MNSAIQNVIDAIDKSQSAVAKRRALAGSVRAVSLIWQKEMARVYNQTQDAFTDRDLGNIKDFIARFGAEKTVALVTWGIENWRQFAKLPYLNKLPPTPIFRSFYFHRDQIFAAWQESLRERPALKIPELPKEEQQEKPRSLVELLKERQRQKAQQ